MILPGSGRYISAPEKKLISRQLQTSSPYLAFRAPSAGLRLTPEEWKLIVSALSAYQHNQTYRPLYEKLTGKASQA